VWRDSHGAIGRRSWGDLCPGLSSLASDFSCLYRWFPHHWSEIPMVALTAKKKLPFNFVVLSDVVPWHILEHASIIPPFIDIPPIVEFVWTQSTPTSTNLSFYHLDCHLKGMPYPHNIHLKSTILLVIFHNFRVSFQLLFLTIFLKPRMVKSCEIPFQTREITINHIYLLENYYFLVIFLVQMVNMLKSCNIPLSHIWHLHKSLIFAGYTTIFGSVPMVNPRYFRQIHYFAG
jgi:hypothetical protein